MDLLVLPGVLVAAAVGAAHLSVRTRRGSAERLRERRNEQPLAHEVPYWTILEAENGAVVVSVDGSYSTFVELDGIDNDCLDDDALNQKCLLLHAVLLNIPAGALLQFLHWSDGDVSRVVERYRKHAGADPVGRLLVERKAQHLLRAGGLSRTRILLGISIPNRLQRGGTGLFRRRFPAFGLAEHERFVRELATLAMQVVRGLGDAGIAVRPLKVAELRQLLYQFLNPGRAELVPDPFESARSAGALRCWKTDQTAREQLVMTGIEEERDRLVVGEKLIRVLTLDGLPIRSDPSRPAVLFVPTMESSFVARLMRMFRDAKVVTHGGRVLRDSRPSRDNNPPAERSDDLLAMVCARVEEYRRNPPLLPLTYLGPMHMIGDTRLYVPPFTPNREQVEAKAKDFSHEPGVSERPDLLADYVARNLVIDSSCEYEERRQERASKVHTKLIDICRTRCEETFDERVIDKIDVALQGILARFGDVRNRVATFVDALDEAERDGLEGDAAVLEAARQLIHRRLGDEWFPKG